jgi:y4mF family transcriptional regulator
MISHIEPNSPTIRASDIARQAAEAARLPASAYDAATRTALGSMSASSFGSGSAITASDIARQVAAASLPASAYDAATRTALGSISAGSLGPNSAITASDIARQAAAASLSTSAYDAATRTALGPSSAIAASDIARRAIEETTGGLVSALGAYDAARMSLGSSVSTPAITASDIARQAVSATGQSSAATSPARPGEASIPVRSAADLGRQVRAARDRLGLSQQAFADMAGVGRRFVSELESGKPTLELGKVLVACQAAGIDLLARSR